MKEDETKNILKELQKCIESPYYFATTYIKVKDSYSGDMVDFYTCLNEEEFNKIFKNYERK